MSFQDLVNRHPIAFAVTTFAVAMIFPYHVASQAQNYDIADAPPKEIHAMKILVDQAVDIKHNNPEYDFKKLNTLSPGFLGTKSELTIYKYGSGIVNNVEGGYTDLFIKENKEAHSLALHSQGYGQDFCEQIQKLAPLSFSQAFELGDILSNDSKSDTSSHVILLKEFYSLIENPDYDISLNGQSIKQNPKSLTCNKNSNSLVLSKKY